MPTRSIENRLYGFAMTHDRSWACGLRCSASRMSAPLDQLATVSPEGAPWLVDYALDGRDGAAWQRSLRRRPWSLWRYHELLPVERLDQRIDLGEGATPLVELRRAAPLRIRLLLKEEGGNPSGSFKDRGLGLALSRARELGVPGVQLASAGNAGLSVCAYAAASGLPARVALPEDTPAVVAARCRAYGAEVLTAPGTLNDAAARLAACDDGYFTVSTFREPYRVEGKKTMGLELAEQLGWKLPDWIVYPTGGGTGIVGMHKAFDELECLGVIAGRRPRFCAVQMAGCAPMVRAFEAHANTTEAWQGAQTEVWGLRVPKSLGDRLVLDALYATGGQAVAIEEARIAQLVARLAAQEGRLFGPEGAACMAAVEDLAAAGQMLAGQTVVVFQTGHPANYGLV